MRKHSFGIGTVIFIITFALTVSAAEAAFASEDNGQHDNSYLLDGVKTEVTGAQTLNPAVTENITPAEQDVIEQNSTYTVANLHIPAGAVCYNGHFYYYYENPDISWDKAFLVCYTYNAHLVTINSADEQAFLEKQYPGTNGWIGLRLKDGYWQWLDNSPLEYTNWCEGEPDNLKGEEGYVHLYTNMQWNDLPTNDTTCHTGFYCEWDSDLVTYEKNGLFDGQISDEARKLLEEGKGYFYGTGPEGFDIDKAWSCFSQATDGYSGEAWYYMGRILENDMRSTNDPFIRAMGAYERAAEYGCQKGWYGMGDMYRRGLGVAQDPSKAMQLYKRAVDMGCEEANCGIALLYEYGLGVDQDYYKAFEYYMKAAEAQNPYAMYCIGWLYEYGKGVSQDYDLAKQWYRLFLDTPYEDIELKEMVGEELAWLTSEENASAYNDYSYDNNAGTIVDYRQDGTPVYADEYYQYETQPWEDPYFIGYTQDGTPQYSYDNNYDYYEYETQPWESPYFIGYTQDGTPQYSY